MDSTILLTAFAASPAIPTHPEHRFAVSFDEFFEGRNCGAYVSMSRFF
jgi:hypothetical protein